MVNDASAEGETADVAVIGAGAAGLVASRRLAEAGRSVLLLEARDRVGGRIWTVGDSVELGAEFVHGRPEATLALLHEAGSDVVEMTGEHFVLKDGRIQHPRERTSLGLHEVIERASGVGRDMPVAEFLAGVVREDPALRAAAARVEQLVEGFDAADPKRASLRALVAEWTGGSVFASTSGRPRGGYAALIDHVVRTLDPARVELRLESVVRAVRWSREGVEIEVDRRGVVQRHRARSAVITLPLGVLQAAPGDPAAVEFEPPLEMKREALAGLTMGPVHKVLLKFSDAIWERVDGGRARDAGFITGEGLPFRTFWTQLPERSSWLTAWVGGPAAERVSERACDAGASDAVSAGASDAASDGSIVAQAVESARALFGGEVDVDGLLEETLFHDWVRDPLSRGAYSYVNVGGTDAGRRLAEPVDGTLYFAGEATDYSGEATTVAGAINSGERVAREVIAAR